MSKKTEVVLSLKQKIKNIHHFFFFQSLYLSLSPSVFSFIESHTQKYKIHFINKSKNRNHIFWSFPVLLTITIFFSCTRARFRSLPLFWFQCSDWSILHTHTHAEAVLNFGGGGGGSTRNGFGAEPSVECGSLRCVFPSRRFGPRWQNQRRRSRLLLPRLRFVQASSCSGLSLSLSIYLFVYVIWYRVGSDWFENFDVF